MKKIFFLALATLLFFNSCIKEEGDTIIQGAEVNNYEITVAPNQWIPVGNFGSPGFYLEAAFRVNYITTGVINYGAVLVYAKFSDGVVQLPYVISREVGGSRMVETLSYVLENGYIIFTLDDSDFETEPYADPISFKIVVVQ